MKVDTKDFNTIEVGERQKIIFDNGLYGFESLKTWVLLDSPKPPFYILQSTKEKEISFVIINPYLVEPSYLLDILDADYEAIQSPQSNHLLVFAIVTVQDQPTYEVTANLMGPLLINRAVRIGIQSINQDSQWKTKHTIGKKREII